LVCLAKKRKKKKAPLSFKNAVGGKYKFYVTKGKVFFNVRRSQWVGWDLQRNCSLVADVDVDDHQ
jgi:hypothetical protein